MSALQKAFHEKLGIQCGFCTPGMIMAAEALLRRVPGLALLVGIQRTPRNAGPSAVRVIGQLTTMSVTDSVSSPRGAVRLLLLRCGNPRTESPRLSRRLQLWRMEL